MANQPKKYKKFVATAATATLVASAIVPVASADETSKFTDIGKYAQDTQDKINALVDAGIIKGTSATTFSPSNDITRGQVVKLLGRYLENELGLEIPEDWEDSRFDDVDPAKDPELAKYAALVYDNEVFIGNNGKLNAAGKITRENMALVVDRAAKAITGTSLVDYAAEQELEHNVEDLDTAKEEAQPAIAALNALGVSTVENFNPQGNVTRANFATFLYNVIEVIAELGDVDVEPIDIEALKAAVIEAGEALVAFEEVTAENAEDVQAAIDAVNEAIEALEAALEEAGEELDEEEAAQLEALKAAVATAQAAIDALPGDEETGETAVLSAASTFANKVEVTFNQSLEALPAASEFSIPGLTVQGVEFKDDTEQKVVTLTTSPQSSQNYTLTYAGKNVTFVGKPNLGAVLLTAAKYEVEIIPGKSQLTPVEIKAQLANVPTGFEAVLEFSTTFGSVVERLTTQNGQAVFQLTPLETLFDQTAMVTARIVEVKNPITGETLPEYKNSSVGTVNVKFMVKDDSSTDQIQSFNINTAYADQADRVYMKVNGGITGKIDDALKYQIPTLIEATESATKKELYRHLHDVMFSQIENAVASGDTTQIKNKLKDAYKDVTITDLRNALYYDVLGKTVLNGNTSTTTGSNFAKYQGLNSAVKSTDLVAEIQTITDAELDGILRYYRLLSKFVVLDNVKDTVAVQKEDQIFAVEHIYKESNDVLVLVLPTDRSEAARDYDTDATDAQAVAAYKEADFLKDNASHQVLFINDTDKDRYELKGDPTFKLEDTTSAKVIAVQDNQANPALVRFKAINSTTPTPTQPGVTNSCALQPFAIDNSGGSGLNPGGTVQTPPTQTPPTFTGDPKLLNVKTYHSFSNVAYLNTNASAFPATKLADLRVVFSESVSLKNNSVLNPKNWKIDGVGLDVIAAQYNAVVEITLDSTNHKKQLRDVAILTVVSKTGNTDAVARFLEFVQGSQHKLEVSKVGDWASETDAQNILPSQALDFAGAKDATAWGNITIAGTPSAPSTNTTTSDVSKIVWDNSNAFVTRVAATTTDTADFVHVLFSEPMKISGTDSILEKANYRLNGNKLPEQNSTIKLGIDGTPYAQSTCAVTIELPKGYLQGKTVDHILAVNNVKGYRLDNGVVKQDSKYVDERVQIAYARQITLVPSKTVTINGVASVNGVHFFENVTAGAINFATDTAFTIESRPYVDTTVNKTPININNWYIGLPVTVQQEQLKGDFFVTHPAGSTTAQ